MHASASVITLTIALGLLHCSSAPVPWPETAGGNGHWYEGVDAGPDGISWHAARDAAAGRGGYLACITSAEENTFVFNLTSGLWVMSGHNHGPWLGAYQDTTSGDYSEPGGGWRWTSGESFSYAAWAPAQPDNGYGSSWSEEFVAFWAPYASPPSPTWNDYTDSYNLVRGYMVEYDATPAFAPANIIVQPVSQTNAVSRSARFSVGAIGALPLSYQWRLANTNLVDGPGYSGVTTPALVITNLQMTHPGRYSVVVTNVFGAQTSSVAQLTLVQAGRFTNLAYSPATGFSFVFRDATLGWPYRIQRSSLLEAGSWTDWQIIIYTEPILLTDMTATGQQRRLYRAISP